MFSLLFWERFAVDQAASGSLFRWLRLAASQPHCAQHRGRSKMQSEGGVLVSWCSFARHVVDATSRHVVRTEAEARRRPRPGWMTACDTRGTRGSASHGPHIPQQAWHHERQTAIPKAFELGLVVTASEHVSGPSRLQSTRQFFSSRRSTSRARVVLPVAAGLEVMA